MTKQGTYSLQRLFRSFKSPKTTVVIIAVLMALFLVGLIVPQKVTFRSPDEYRAWQINRPLLTRSIEALRLNEISRSPLTILFLGLFFANLMAVIGSRIPVVLRKSYLLRREPLVAELPLLKQRPNVLSLETRRQDSRLLPDIRTFLKKHSWSFLDTGSPDAVFAIRNRYSPLGSLLFHLSFFFCLAGGLLIMYTRFTGELVLTEGQEFNADIQQFRRITREPELFKGMPNVQLLLEKVDPHYQWDLAKKTETPVMLNVSLKVKYRGEIRNEVARVNEPVTRGPLTFLSKEIGIAPLFVLTTAGGRMVDGGYVTLKVMNGTEDSFLFEAVPYEFFVKFYPDHVLENGRHTTRSKAMTNPYVTVRIIKGGKQLTEKTFAKGQSISFDSLKLSFDEVRYWVNFIVIREYGEIPLFIGYGLGALGLIMRLMFYQRSLLVAVERKETGTRIWVDGRSEYYQHSFAEELTHITADLKSSLESEGPGGRGEAV